MTHNIYIKKNKATKRQSGQQEVGFFFLFGWTTFTNATHRSEFVVRKILQMSLRIHKLKEINTSLKKKTEKKEIRTEKGSQCETCAVAGQRSSVYPTLLSAIRGFYTVQVMKMMMMVVWRWSRSVQHHLFVSAGSCPLGPVRSSRSLRPGSVHLRFSGLSQHDSMWGGLRVPQTGHCSVQSSGSREFSCGRLPETLHGQLPPSWPAVTVVRLEVVLHHVTVSFLFNAPWHHLQDLQENNRLLLEPDSDQDSDLRNCF